MIYAFEDLKAEILASGLSFARIADLSGVHVTTIYHWFTGCVTRPRIDTVDRVAAAVRKSIVLSEFKFRRNTPTVGLRPPAMTRHQVKMAMLRAH